MKNGILFLFLTLSAFSSLTAQEAINLFGNLDFGPHLVGTKQLAVDHTTNGTSTSLNIQLWYPGNENGDKLIFSDYLNYKGKFSHQELLENLSVGISGVPDAFPNNSLELVLNAQMKASKNVAPKNGQFPLLVWSLRYGTVESQFLISEYLASQGYVVAFVEDKPNSGFPWQLPSAEEKESVLNQQIADLNHAITHLKKQQNIDKDRIGILSWSYAGESAILTQMSNSDIDLVVGLSSIGFSYGVYSGGELPNKIVTDQIQVPYLILSEKIGTNGKERTPPDIFDDMNSNSRYVSFEELSHGNFNAMEGMIPGILNTNKVQSWSKGGKVAQLGFETICKIALSFINTTLKPSNSSSFDDQMKELDQTLPPTFISVFQPKSQN